MKLTEIHVNGDTLPGDDEALLKPAEVAALFRIDPKTVGKWANAGKLTIIRTPGGHRRYRESEVTALLAAGTCPGLPPEDEAAHPDALRAAVPGARWTAGAGTTTTT